MATYQISDDDMDSILMRLVWDIDSGGKPNRCAQRIAEDLRRQQADSEVSVPRTEGSI